LLHIKRKECIMNYGGISETQHVMRNTTQRIRQTEKDNGEQKSYNTSYKYSAGG